MKDTVHTNEIGTDTFDKKVEDNKQSFWKRSKSKEKEKTSVQTVSISSLFRYAKRTELFYLLVGILASAAFGVVLPIIVLIYGDTMNNYIHRASNLCSLNLTSLSAQFCPSHISLTSINFYTNIKFCNLTGSNLTITQYDLMEVSRKPMFTALICAFVSILSGYIRVASLNILAERQSRTIRQIFFRSILKKDVVFFDKYQTGQLNLHLTENINKIQNGIGDKLGSVVEMLATTIACFVIGFSRGWKLAFVVLSLSPVIIISLTVLFKISGKWAAKELQTYGKAGAIAEEVISSIRTVLSYNGQEKEIHKYEQHLDDAKRCGMRKTFIICLSKGVTFFLLFCIYALGFWYGAKLIREEGYNIGNVFTIFMEINFGVFCLGQTNTFFQAVSEARAAAFVVWEIIDEPSTIDSNRNVKNEKDQLTGEIRFSNVHFSYPSRLDIPILSNLSFQLKSGETVALVGTSGSGKSTCVQLLQRFYEPQLGSIKIDGKSVCQYNLNWLRQHIGVVSQEPVLFQTTIRQNILFGRESATDEEIHRAAKMANAHDFIMTLPDKYETEVGDRGGALSGGQKQRIAIARALLRDPKILLLDEATSALDNESEKIVQEALNRAAEGRTTLIIAHRLSTIRHADKIIVMQKGEIIEEGDHDTLMKNESVYFNLVQQQTTHEVGEKEEEEFEKEETRKRLLSEQVDSDIVIPRQRASTLISVTLSILNALHAKTNSVDHNNDENYEESKEKIEDKKKHNITLTLLKANKPEWYLIIIGCIAASLNAVREIVYAVVQTNLATVFQECDLNEQKQKVSTFVLIYLGLGVFALLANIVQGYVFARSGEAVTKRLRSLAFRSILRQEINFFDQPNHNTGVLCTRLAVDASAVQGATGIRFGSIFENLFSMTIGIIVGLIYSWRVTLPVLPFVPMILIGGVLQIRLTTKLAKKQRAMIEDAAKITTETFQNIRTVFTLSKEDYFFDQFSQILDNVYRSSLKSIHILAITYAISSSMFYFTVTVFIYVSALFLQQNLETFLNIFMVVNTVVFTARNVGRALTILPDYGKAIEAAQNIFYLINRKPKIDNQSNDGEQISNFQGEIKFDNVYFTYPNRPESIILQNLQLNVKSGQRVAFVGTSGCGKSTSVQLIERFYDPTIGSISVDSKDIRSLDLQWYRSQIGIVSQEPVLFNVSIRENIAYGDNSRSDIPLEEIIEVAKQANIHDFILTLPQGYETNCGSKGAQLSGGQKQRIAIARALIRNPKILLLDEATSALDSESEKIVQEALDRAQENRTSITIAHRLSTIRNSDLICVLHRGAIVESGNHDELMALNGRYYRLVEGKLK